MPSVDEVLNAPKSAGVTGKTPAPPVPLFIAVGADKGGTGKTTVSRTVDDYLALNRIIRKVYDSEFPKGDLKRFVSEAQVVNLLDVDDQMKTFDSVEGVSLLDIKAGQMSTTIEALNKTGMLDYVRSGELRFAFLHVLGHSVASLDEIGAMVEALGSGSHYFPVKNLSDEYGFQEWENDPRFKEQLQVAAPVTITVPHLAARAATEVQLSGLSFDRFRHTPVVNGKETSRMLRGYVDNWLKSVHKEFDRVGLGKLIKGAV